MSTVRNTRPKWSDLNDLAGNVITAENNLLKRKTIFENIVNSETASEKDKTTANNVLIQIEDIITDNKIALKNIKATIAKKTHLKPRAGVSEKDQVEYFEILTKIDARLSATGSFDQMLLQRLSSAINKEKEINNG